MASDKAGLELGETRAFVEACVMSMTWRWDSAVQPVGEVADMPGMLIETSSSRSSPAARSWGIKIDVSNVADAKD
jgi:hypothetical protein